MKNYRINNRRAFRVKVYGVKVRIDDGADVLDGVVEDLSCLGVSFFTQERISEGNKLLVFSIKDEDFTVRAERGREDFINDAWKYAYKFVDIKPDAEERLRRILLTIDIKRKNI